MNSNKTMSSYTVIIINSNSYRTMFLISFNVLYSWKFWRVESMAIWANSLQIAKNKTIQINLVVSMNN